MAILNQLSVTPNIDEKIQNTLSKREFGNDFLSMLLTSSIGALNIYTAENDLVGYDDWDDSNPALLKRIEGLESQISDLQSRVSALEG